MKAIITYISILLISVGIVCQAADPIYNLDTWSDVGVSGWTNEATSDVLLSNPGGSLNASHQPQTAPKYVEDTVKIPVASGSYITNISFALSALEYKPSKLRVQFHSTESDDVWSLDLTAPEPGNQIVVNEPLTFSAGWSIGADSPEAQFLNDLWSIDWVGIEIRRNADIETQNYSIDDFLIRGLFYIVDDDLDKMADSWEETYGLNSNDVNDAGLDKDGDGMSNYAEYRAGSDPENPNSLFLMEIDRISVGGEIVSFELRWDSIENRSYTIWKATDLNENFFKLEEGIHPTPSENVYEDPAETNGSVRFYRVEVEPEI